MANWDENSFTLKNDDKIYSKFFKKIGIQSVDHKSIVVLGDPMREDFLKDIMTTEHLFSAGDTLSKISFSQYGDPKFWWVIAWFNSKPTDLHCEIGDTIYIPFPLEEAISQATERGEL